MELIEYRGAKIARPVANPILKRVVDFLAEHDISGEEAGIHQVSEDFSYNILELETTTPENRAWESHRDFYDVHVIFQGREKIAFNHVSAMNLGDYVADVDWQQMTGEPLFHVVLEPGEILLLDPNDAHETALIADHAQPIRKAVFKVRV
ncbi:YhcH/YjgK/YiaL family protein [Neoactinobaculum massilliense]|uniref:YhcH/YjgK/YiaL family protein n=1 Tax=Neoactinobaculum massilliense TaxID=2364794 RepID=UPI000F542B15|nr:YhcH/YjgK/YiaL family protein [Neoactinobaculum massilliense]